MKNILVNILVVVAVVVGIGCGIFYLVNRGDGYTEAEEKANQTIPSYILDEDKMETSELDTESIDDNVATEVDDADVDSSDEVDDTAGKEEETEELVDIEIDTDVYSDLAITSSHVKLAGFKDFREYVNTYGSMLTVECYNAVREMYEYLSIEEEDLTEGYTEGEVTQDDLYPIYDEKLYIVSYGTKEESDVSYQAYLDEMSDVSVKASTIEGNEIIYTLKFGKNEERVIRLQIEENTGLVNKITEE